MADTLKPCPNIESNQKRCTCPNTGCARYGLCCQCVHYHLSKGDRPQCFVKAGV